MIAIGGNKVVAAYKGGAEIRKAYLGSEVVFDNSGSALPYDAEIEYLEARDGSYIDTGIYITKSTRVEIKHQIIALYNECASDIQFFVALTSNSDATYCFRTGGNAIRTRWGSSSSTDLTGLVKNDIILFTVDGTKYVNLNVTRNKSTTANTGNSYSQVTFKLFHPNGARPVRIFYAKVGDLDLIPVRKDGVGYMYDRASGRLFGNGKSGGSFILGNDV